MYLTVLELQLRGGWLYNVVHLFQDQDEFVLELHHRVVYISWVFWIIKSNTLIKRFRTEFKTKLRMFRQSSIFTSYSYKDDTKLLKLFASKHAFRWHKIIIKGRLACEHFIDNVTYRLQIKTTIKTITVRKTTAPTSPPIMLSEKKYNYCFWIKKKQVRLF